MSLKLIVFGVFFIFIQGIQASCEHCRDTNWWEGQSKVVKGAVLFSVIFAIIIPCMLCCCCFCHANNTSTSVIGRRHGPGHLNTIFNNTNMMEQQTNIPYERQL
ncbi:uncharacterized protein LOC130614391 [Hydractinia symbiolongicarpus]|uniref:uncharacterized protein LOC130614391 n=1 Tax=Hydractinia symbiolongicarpus TaxID=13093 RepID=UPI002551440E|nr:uncharacterized protein LOC130614391 [Hydractinia symbiolongicarpus]